MPTAGHEGNVCFKGGVFFHRQRKPNPFGFAIPTTFDQLFEVVRAVLQTGIAYNPHPKSLRNSKGGTGYQRAVLITRANYIKCPKY